MSWSVKETDNGIHVIPVNDVEPHEEDVCFDGIKHECKCKCQPRSEIENGIWIFIHGAFDGREALEEAKEILKL